MTLSPLKKQRNRVQRCPLGKAGLIYQKENIPFCTARKTPRPSCFSLRPLLFIGAKSPKHSRSNRPTSRHSELAARVPVSLNRRKRLHDRLKFLEIAPSPARVSEQTPKGGKKRNEGAVMPLPFKAGRCLRSVSLIREVIPRVLGEQPELPPPPTPHTQRGAQFRPLVAKCRPYTSPLDLLARFP